LPTRRRKHMVAPRQRSPPLLYGGGDTTVETAGIDYVLPYWMARYYQVLAS